MVENYEDCIAFVIDTEQYAGNFEREMCAHLTGRIGDCEVGEELVDPVLKEMFYNVVDMPDDHACYRPTTCFPLKDKPDNNAVAIFFDKNDPPTEEQITLMKERANEFQEVFRTKGRMAEFNKDALITITGFRLIEFSTTRTEKEI